MNQKEPLNWITGVPMLITVWLIAASAVVAGLVVVGITAAVLHRRRQQ